MDSIILNSLKDKIIGNNEDSAFDNEILDNVNFILSGPLNQIGFNTNVRVNKETKWEELTGDDKLLDDLKIYIQFRLRIMFDPSASQQISNIHQDIIKETEYRIILHLETS